MKGKDLQQKQHPHTKKKKTKSNPTKAFYVKQRMKLHISNTMWLKSKRRGKQTEISVCVCVGSGRGTVGKRAGLQIIVDSSTVRLCTHTQIGKLMHSLTQCALS